MRSKYLDDVVRALPIALVSSALAVTLGAAADSKSSTQSSKSAVRRDADLMKQKVATINRLGEKPQKERKRTTVTEKELNAYLELEALGDLPKGVVNPTVSIVGAGRLSGRAVVDLDAVRKESPPRSLLDPKNLLVGRLPIAATGVLTTSNGVGRFALESASVGGLPIPKFLLQEILTYYSRSPERPDGLNLDDPFNLPVRIREIQVGRGQAIVVQ
jgi:hypothetical protein